MPEMPFPIDAEKILATLVAFDTTSSKSNRACIDYIGAYLAHFGIASEILVTDDGAKACLWATLGRSDRKGIVLAGHTDTVPIEGQHWSSDPFTLTERDGKLYGRGSCDMKAFIACALAVVPELAGRSLQNPVHFAFTHDEETDMSGAARLTDFLGKNAVKPSWVWIGEPTLLHTVDTHKGVAAFATKITGVAAHSGQPDKGLSAIELGNDFMSIIRRAAEAKKDKPFSPSRFDPPYTTFNLGIVKGGTAENIIAEHCDILWQARAHPGDDVEAALADIERQAVEQMAPRFKAFAPHGQFKTCMCFNIPPLMPTADNPGTKCLAQIRGDADLEAASFATEGGFFQRLGTHVVICGPGSIDQAHKADEYVEKTQVSCCVDLIRQVLLCSGAA
jgi:acetylornithine deacetylase